MKAKKILLLCMVTLAVMLSACRRSEAAPQEAPSAKALTAYREILQAAPAIEGEHEQLQDATFGYEQNQALFGNHYDLFALADLNQDGIPELIAMSVVNFRWAPVSVFTYADGNAVLLKDPLDGGTHGTFEQCSTAGGAYYTCICEENHLHSVWRGTTPIGEEAEENHAYVLGENGLAEVECTAPQGENTIYFSDLAMTNTAENRAVLTGNS